MTPPKRIKRPRQIKWRCENCGHHHKHNVQVPIHLLTGQLERLNDQQVKEQARDINAEVLRRGYRLSDWIKNL